MPILDFTEIAQANKANGQQDSFELFARDFLEHLGYNIIQGPDRGADGGKDLIVEESHPRIRNKNLTFSWMVSCKHFAHSGKSVNPDDERSIRDRVEGHQCDGFMGFYSTIASSGLADRLENLGNSMQHYIFDKEDIERELLGNPACNSLAKRYFPISFNRYLGGIGLDLIPGSYLAVIKGRRSRDLRSIEVKPGETCYLLPTKGDNYIQWIYIINEIKPEVASMFDFSGGTLPNNIRFTRMSSATYYSSPAGDLVTAECGEPRFEEVQPGLQALLVEPPRTNLFQDSSNPRTQVVHLSPGTYTIWVKGSGAAEFITSNLEAQTVTENQELVYTAIQNESCTIKVSGNLAWVQLEDGEGATSYIETPASCSVVRASDLISVESNSTDSVGPIKSSTNP